MADEKLARPSLLLFVPLLFFLLIGILFWRGLSEDPALLPSSLIGRPAPAFDLQPITGLSVPGLKTGDLKNGGVTVVNIWASWCIPCRQEHPLLMKLAVMQNVQLVGINNKDTDANAAGFLNALGQPFAAIGADHDGRVTIDWGGYGVPETFIVDGGGIIRYKHIGPLTEDDFEGKFGAALRAAKNP